MPHAARNPATDLTLKAAAEPLGVCPPTPRNRDRAGKLTPARHSINRCRPYRRADLQALVRSLGRGKIDGD